MISNQNHGYVKKMMKNLDWASLKLSPLQKELVDLDQVFDKSADAIILITRDFNVLRVNPTFKEMANLNYAEEVRGMKCYELMFGPNCHTVDCPLARIMNGEEKVEFEASRIFSNGRKIPTLLSVRSLRNPDDQVIGIIEFIRDISPLKESENALRQSENKFKTYIDQSPDGIVITNNRGRHVEVNDAFCNLLKYTRDELIGSPIKDFTDPEDWNKFKLLKRGGSSRVEITIFTKNGESIKAEVHGAALNDGLHIGFIRDISSWKLAEEALRESERSYNLILNGISDMVVLYEVSDDLNLKVIKTNNTFVNLVGFSEDQVIGKYIQELLPSDMAAVITNNIREAVLAKELSSKSEEWINGSLFDATHIPIYDKDGRWTHLIVTARDVTSQRKLEEHMQKVEKLESVGLLAGGIAHDFNNFLTVILGNISMAKIKTEKLAAEYSDLKKIPNLLGEAERASVQARGLTQQLLTFAKGGTPVLKPSSLGNLLRESVGFALSGSNVRCEFDIPEGLWTVELDEGQINQVIYNLVINADQAMPNGGIIDISAQNIHITSSMALPLNEGRFVRVTIADSGVGICEEYLDKVFDPYFTTKQKGSGLGLATSYSIIMKHQGFITVNSHLGKGTTFNIFLPASDNEPVTGNRAALKINDDQIKGRVLVMDDDQMVRFVLEEMLRHLGYDAVSVKDGHEAIEKYRNSKNGGQEFDAVIMDLTIPGGMGGKDTIGKLREIDPQVKAIVSSGYSNDPVMADFQDFGFQAVLAKPFSVEQIDEVLQMVI